MSFSGKCFFREASFQGNKFPRKLGSIFLGKLRSVFPRKLGNVFSGKLRCVFLGKQEMFSQGSIIIKEYVYWKNVILGKSCPQYASPVIPPSVFSLGDLSFCSPKGSCFEMPVNPFSPHKSQPTPIIFEKSIFLKEITYATSFLDLFLGEVYHTHATFVDKLTMNSTYLMVLIFALALSIMKAFGFHLGKLMPHQTPWETQMCVLE